MTQISDFQTITEQYANTVAKEHGTRVDWVCIDGSQSHVKQQYPKRRE